MGSNESGSDSQSAAVGKASAMRNRVEADDICTIACVGDSAGRLEAFTQLLKHLPHVAQLPPVPPKSETSSADDKCPRDHFHPARSA